MFIVKDNRDEDFTPRNILKLIKVTAYDDAGVPTELVPHTAKSIVSFPSSVDRVVFDVNITDSAGDVIQVDASFDLPLAGELGTLPRIVPVTFVQGEASISLGGWTSGRWRVSADEVNMDIDDPNEQFEFGGIVIKVTE